MIPMQQRSEQPEPLVDKVVDWRMFDLGRIFPEMTPAQLSELARGNDRELLARARKLADAGCNAACAFRILL